MTPHRLRPVALFVALLAALGGVAVALDSPPVSATADAGGAWASDPVWHDGLVEKAVYDATKVIYGKPRSYEATLLTNKEAHDPATWTKSKSGGGTEVWKFNQIEVVPTPNYDYKFETTCHLETRDLSLTRLDATSQEWCGATFKQFHRRGQPHGGGGAVWEYAGFSYLPEQGRQNELVAADGWRPVVPANALALYLRGYPFDDAVHTSMRLSLIPDQKSNKLEPRRPVPATVAFAGETPDGYRLDVTLDGASGGDKLGTYTFAKDRRHVLLAYDGANGDKLALKSLDRVDYWTRHEE